MSYRTWGEGIAKLLSKKCSVLVISLLTVLSLCTLFSPSASAATAVTAWGSYGTADGQFDPAWGIAADGAGNIYVGENGATARIQKFDANGDFISAFVSGADVSNAAGMAFDVHGNLYVADSGYQQVRVFSPSGSLAMAIGSPGAGDGQFASPRGLAFDSAGDFYVADYGNDRVQKFGPDGAYLSQWHVASPSGIAIGTNDAVYTASASDNRIYKTTTTGMAMQNWGGAGIGHGQLNGPQGVAVADSGMLYVADQGNSRIQGFDTAGTYKTQWGSSGAAVGQFSKPQFIAVSGNSVYVTEYGNARVQKFTPVNEANGAPDAPSSLSAVAGDSGSSASTTPQLTFTARDQNSADTLTYHVQVATDSGFSNLIVDYTSRPASQGPAAFMIGQANDGGTYAVGSAGQTLPDGTYYWRVQATDQKGSASAFSTAPQPIVVDTASPTLESVAAGGLTDLTLTFSEPVTAGSGSIYIYRVSDNSIVESIAVTSTQLVVSADATTITLHPSGLAADTAYVLSLDAGAFRDQSGNAMATASGQFVIPRGAPVPVQPSTSTHTGVTATPKPITVVRTITVQPKVLGATTIQPAKPRLLLNDFKEFLGSGKQLALKVNDVVYFTANDQSYSAAIAQLDGDTASIYFAPVSRTVKLAIGSSHIEDLDGDGRGDIQIMLVGIANGVADVAFKRAEATAQAETAVATAVGNSLPRSPKDTPAGSGALWVYFLVAAAILAVGMAFRAGKPKPSPVG